MFANLPHLLFSKFDPQESHLEANYTISIIEYLVCKPKTNQIAVFYEFSTNLFFQN